MRWRAGVWIVLTTLALMVSGCGSNNFMVYKDGRNFYVTSNCEARQKLLCDSGDIDRIVAGASLTHLLAEQIIEAMCTKGVSVHSLHDILAAMTDKQLSSLKQSFIENGYEINKPLDA